MNFIGLDDFTVSNIFGVDAVESCLRKHGVAVLPAWATGACLDGLRKEFLAILEDKDDKYIYPINYSPGQAVSIMRSRIPENKYPNIRDVFSNQNMKALARRYVGEECHFNYEVYATHEFRPDVDVAPTHFDKLWTLKYMLYLNDIGPKNAPFGVIPRSAHVARDRFRNIFRVHGLHRLRMDDERYQSMDNSSIPDNLGPVVDIVGPAGTLIIFDTDTFHHAGVVSRGKERQILRGHSGPAVTYTSVRRGGRQWWRGEKPFNRLDIWKEKILERFF